MLGSSKTLECNCRTDKIYFCALGQNLEALSVQHSEAGINCICSW